MGKPVVSLAVEFPHGGKAYKGVSLKQGVTLGSKPAGCGVPKTQLTFQSIKSVDGEDKLVDTIEQPIAFLENVSGADFESSEVPAGYLVIHP